MCKRVWMTIAIIVIIMVSATFVAVVSSIYFSSAVDYKRVSYNVMASKYVHIYNKCCNITDHAADAIYTVSEEGAISSFEFWLFDGGIYRRNLTINPPLGVGDMLYPAVYISSDVIYVGSRSGKIYYADPVEGTVIWTFDINRLHINFTNYHILWGNKTGYFYLLTNNTMYYIYQDYRVLNKSMYNFTGYLEGESMWHGGFILDFVNLSSDNSYEKHDIYYVKDGKILWHISPYTRNICCYVHKYVYIHNGTVYVINDTVVTPYTAGKITKVLNFKGNIASLQFAGGKILVITYEGTKNMLYVYDEKYNLIKKTLLFDLTQIGIKKVPPITTGQKVALFRFHNRYIMYLYTADEETYYLPLRIIYLDDSFKVLKTENMRLYPSLYVYPMPGTNSVFIIDSEQNSYIATPTQELKMHNYGYYISGLILLIGILAIARVAVDHHRYLSLKKKAEE